MQSLRLFRALVLLEKAHSGELGLKFMYFLFVLRSGPEGLLLLDTDVNGDLALKNGVQCGCMGQGMGPMGFTLRTGFGVVGRDSWWSVNCCSFLHSLFLGDSGRRTVFHVMLIRGLAR